MSLIGGLVIYFIPGIIALFKRSKYTWDIFALNLFLGWLVIPYILLLLYVLFMEDGNDS